MFQKKYNNLTQNLAALKEDIKTLKMAGEDDAIYDLFVRETRLLIGKRPKLPENFNGRTSDKILKDLRK